MAFVIPSGAYASTEYGGFPAENALSAQSADWYSNTSPHTVNQKWCAVFNEAVAVNRIIIENSHSYDVMRGMKNFSIYGSNSIAAVNNIATYSDETDLTLLGSGFTANPYNTSSNLSEAFEFENSTAYLYYLLKIADNWGGNLLGARHFQFDLTGPLLKKYAKYPFVSCVRSGTTPLRTDRHFLGGVIKVNGVPAKKRVVVLDRHSMSIYASTYSNSVTGEWKIRNTLEYRERRLLVLAFDDSGEFNAEVADFVSQVEEVTEPNEL